MKVSILACPFGLLAFSPENELVDYALFPRDPVKAAQILHGIESGKLVEELASLVQRLQNKGYAEFVFENGETARKTQETLGITATTAELSEIKAFLRRNMAKIAQETGFVEDSSQLTDWIRIVTFELAKMKVKRAVEKRDLMVAQAIQTIDDLDKTANLFMGRLREWYGLHFPELDRLVEKHETYARLVSELGERENFSIKKLAELGVPERKAEKIIEAAEKSMGAAFRKEDLEKLRAICKTTLELYERRKELEKYVEEAMDEVAPNVKALVGALLGARLIALAGSLENLAKMPASTIQVLGAEKALFRALRTGSKPPKHGVIFQHTYLREAKRWQRGKIARALAGKLAIAARTDAYSGKFIGDELKTSLEKRIEEIKEKYSEPPQKVYRPSKPKKRKKRRKKHGRS